MKTIYSASRDAKDEPTKNFGVFKIKACNYTKTVIIYSSKINFKNIRLNSVYKALTNPDHWDKGFKTAIQEFVKESRHLCKDWSGDLQTEKNEIDTKLDQVIDIYNNKNIVEF